jgi:hypothetical protein
MLQVPLSTTVFRREKDGHIKAVYATIGKLILAKAIIIVAGDAKTAVASLC